MSGSRFEFSGYLSRTTSLRRRLVDIGSSDDARVKALTADVPVLRETGRGGDGTATTLSLGFVGQYNAGKSTIISALTDKVTAYDREGIQLLDLRLSRAHPRNQPRPHRRRGDGTRSDRDAIRRMMHKGLPGTPDCVSQPDDGRGAAAWLPSCARPRPVSHIPCSGSCDICRTAHRCPKGSSGQSGGPRALAGATPGKRRLQGS